MYIPTIFREGDLVTLVDFMRTYSFATLVSNLNGMPFATHVPLVVSLQDQAVSLIGHLAKANPHWQAFSQGKSLAIFTGPHAYISPSLYESPENVPTWNYIAVHAYGTPQLIQFDGMGDRSNSAMEAMIDKMIHSYEPTYKQQWQNLSEHYRQKMMQGIVGFEMPITQLEGKYKLSQNRSSIDQQNIVHTLLQHSDPAIAHIGQAMQDQ